jgi:hypothetical protein
MRDIAKLLFGGEAGTGEAGILSELFAPGDSDGFGMADRARRAGEWCGTTPGRDSAADALRRVARPRGPHRRTSPASSPSANSAGSC